MREVTRTLAYYGGVILVGIPGREGYFLDSEGGVYSKWINKGMHGLVLGETVKKLKGSTRKDGYKSIQFGRKGGSFLVHRLMYQTFVGDIPEGIMIRHLDDDPRNNRIENLATGTQKDNMADAKRNGIFPRGSTNGRSKLSESDVIKIKSLLDHQKQTEIASLFGVSRRTISFIQQGKTWKHVD